MVDGNEKKFFWPDKEMVRRDMLLSKMFAEADSCNVALPAISTIPSNTATTELNMDIGVDGAAEKINSKPPRRDMPRLSRKTVVAGRAAFDI